MDKSIKVVVIVGPTAVGKTALSIKLAKQIDGEIISGDAVQVYRGMNIGSAKITNEEMDGIPHYLIDILNPDEQYSAAQFKEMAVPLIEDIHARGKIPMIVGGTGLYIQSVLFDYQYREENAAERDHWLKFYDDYSTKELFDELRQRDPAASDTIHENNRQRLMRAIIFNRMHNQSITTQSKNQTIHPKYDTLLIGLNMPRELLYERINRRVDLMMDEGLIEEVAQLMDAGYSNTRSMTAIGYKEIMPYINGEMNREQAIIQLKQNSRRFAKRQLTWFRNQMSLEWYDMTAISMDDMVNILTIKVKGESL
ncbi:tRNA (adenosine(37)-N6)-dimethylallyltransferase MiaA [Macrococcus lamae]|uniref:tRNA dimethylallyltransferase n=1 Tax=Macrococcus lamae TaxID=198484 RepID=A0A4R6BUW3_9STAP|nr:tRNA (adenosine(37)-N6)-dimethylallyltransferase MiaA [Macrococcus lamae]TDM11844.1 tRNA (adenosine(37)-N6)-dimethylallyltransferase MiaA [Macrococcus lamae]